MLGFAHCQPLNQDRNRAGGLAQGPTDRRMVRRGFNHADSEGSEPEVDEEQEEDHPVKRQQYRFDDYRMKVDVLTVIYRWRSFLTGFLRLRGFLLEILYLDDLDLLS